MGSSTGLAEGVRAEKRIVFKVENVLPATCDDGSSENKPQS